MAGTVPPVAPYPPIFERDEVPVTGVSGLVAFGTNVILQGKSLGKLNVATVEILDLAVGLGGAEGSSDGGQSFGLESTILYYDLLVPEIPRGTAT